MMLWWNFCTKRWRLNRDVNRTPDSSFVMENLDALMQSSALVSSQQAGDVSILGLGDNYSRRVVPNSQSRLCSQAQAWEPRDSADVAGTTALFSKCQSGHLLALCLFNCTFELSAFSNIHLASAQNTKWASLKTWDKLHASMTSSYFIIKPIKRALA